MRRLIARCIAPIAHILGVAVVPEWALAGFPLETHLRALFRALKIGTVIDVGANKGQFRDFLRRRVGFAGLIHSFEPDRTLAERLEVRARSDSNWIIHDTALGSQEIDLHLNIMAQSVFNSFLEPDESRTHHFTRGNTVVGTQKVRVKKLDDVFESLAGHEAPLYLKIDTQGFDAEVLDGARQVLSRIRALQLELAVQPIYKGAPNYREVLRGLEDSGFELSGMFPVSFDESLRIVELDCVVIARNWKTDAG
jgi:FkbM family methyltransferase